MTQDMATLEEETLKAKSGLMCTSQVTDWMTPQHGTLSRTKPSMKGSGCQLDLPKSLSPLAEDAAGMYSLDSIPQRLSAGSHRCSPSKPIFINSGGSLQLPGYVSIPRADADDEVTRWKKGLSADPPDEPSSPTSVKTRDYYEALFQGTTSAPTYKQTSQAPWSFNNKAVSEDLQLAEHQYQLKKVQAQLQDVQQKMDCDVNRLQDQLGATEYEVEKLKKMSKEKEQQHRRDLEAIVLKLKEKENQSRQLHKKLTETEEELSKSKQRCGQLQNYLRDLPTVDELKESTELVRKLEADNEKQTAKIQLMEKKLKKGKEMLQEKINEIHNMEVSKDEAEIKVDRLNASLARYRERDALGPVDVQEYEECQWENQMLKSEKDRLKKMVDSKHKKLKALHHENQKNEKKLQEQISREEDTINAMREQANSKDSKLDELRQSVREMSLQNQTLMEENLNLQDSIQKYETVLNKESKAIHAKVDKELASCMSELKSMVLLCESKAAGEQPDISSIFGRKGKSRDNVFTTQDNDNTSSDPFSYDSAKARHTNVKELQACIDTLRALISEQYAEEIGNNCVAQ